MIRKCIPLLLVLVFPTCLFAYQQIDFVREIGDAGKKAKQRLLNGPRALAAAGDRIFVADTNANRILVMDREGQMVRAWGTKGDKPGRFRLPGGIAVDERGRVYVSDTGNHRIQVLDAEGKAILVIGRKGSGPREFSHPAGIAVRRGFLYVADKGNSRVQILSPDGIFIREILLKDKKDEMREPVAIAVDLQNRITVLDSAANRVWVFDHRGALIGKFGDRGSGTEGFDEPQGLALDAVGNVFISDTGNAKLKKFNPQGKLVASFGSEGRGPGQFREAAGIAIDDRGDIYALDADKGTLQVFSCETGEGFEGVDASPLPSVELYQQIPGRVSGLVVEKGRLWVLTGDSLSPAAGGTAIGKRGSGPGMLRNPRAVAADHSGNFWIVDTGNDRLQKFGQDGSLLQVIGKSGSKEGEFDSPLGMAVAPKGNIYVADTDNDRVQVFNSKGMFLGMFGKSGNSPGQLDEPADVAVDGSGNVYVADRGNDRIAKYDGNGTLLWESGKTGEKDGEFKEPSNLLVSPDNEVYVLDSGNGRVQVLDTDGKFVRAFGNAGQALGELDSPRGIALEAGRLLSVGDAGNNRVQVYAIRHTPAVPAGLSAEARPNEIQLSWKGGIESYLEQYVLYRSETAVGPFTVVGTSRDPFYIDKALPSNAAFFYRVAAKARGGNESALSSPASAVTPRLVPAAPKKVKINASEKQMTVSWLPNREPFVTGYRVYRTMQISSGFELAGEVDRTVFIDTGLADRTFYYYQVTAVGKEGDESPASDVVYASTPKASLALPPLEITGVEMEPVFASAYKFYESNPLGTVTIRNNTDTVFPGIKVSFSIRDFMDYPTEVEVKDVPALDQVKVELRPVFNNRILHVTENTPVQSELAVTFYSGGEARTVARSYPVTLYERHAMVWDRKAKLGAYVTPKDPPVADYSRAVVRPYVDSHPNLHQTIVYARAVYGSLGALGLKYIVDPTSPFQEFSEKSGGVDYLQYPRDTLFRKSGDCDDLAILFSALMENIGIATAFVDVPGHVFVMFNTGVPEGERADLGFPDAMIVLDKGTVWIPVEMTLVGSSFTRAWQKAAEEYREWSAQGKAEVVNTHSAWETFKPVTLPTAEERTVKVSRDEIEALFRDELEALGRERLANLSAEYRAILEKQPDSLEALAGLGILYGENGHYSEALEQFQKMLAVDRTSSLALNNIGNVYFLQGRPDDAKIAYESALASSPEDTGIMTNLARVLFKLEQKEEARKALQTAAGIDPRVLRRNADLVKGLGMK